MYETPGWSWNSLGQQPIPGQQRPFSNTIAPRYEIIKVNGEAGARNFRMAANSSALLLDGTAPIVWYAQTDGTGYLTVTPFDIRPHQTPTPVDLNDLSTRVAKLEELFANVQQPYTGTTKQPKKQQRQQSNLSAETATSESTSITTN